MKTMGRFLGLGAVSTLADYTVFSGLVLAGADYVLAIVLGYACGLWVNYDLGRRYVFTSGTRFSRQGKEFAVVALIAGFGLLLNIAIVKLLTYGIWEFDIMVSRIGAIGVVFLWNYYARRLFVYY